MMQKISLLFCVWACLACAKSIDTSDRAALDEGVIVDSSTLLLNSGSLTGTGRYLVNTSLRTSRSNIHLNLAGQFIDPVNSFFILHLFFDDFFYDVGVQLRFVLVDNPAGGKSIDVEFAEPGKSFRHLTQIDDVLNSDLSFNIRIEAHNQLNNTRRILIWNNFITLQSNKVIDLDKIMEGNTKYDSLSTNMVFFEWGQGLRWGLNLNQMRVSKFNREVPFVNP